MDKSKSVFQDYANARSWEVHPIVAGSRCARVFSPSNIAVAKYWGKRDIPLNLPTNGSISLTLRDFGSFTTAEFDPSFKEDELYLNGQKDLGKDGKLNSKVALVLNELRKISGSTLKARIQSGNNFPTAAGLASSASGFSALTLAAATALKLDLSLSKLSEIARQGSGSACRSFFGGFSEWKRGEKSDGSDSVAHPLLSVSQFPLSVFVAVVQETHKTHASTSAMEHTRKTSPYFESWVESAESQLKDFREAILKKDFDQLGLLAESNCTRMHTSSMAAFPPIFYWQPKTLEIMYRAWSMRAAGLRVFFTIDAGPNVVLVCMPEDSSKVLTEIEKIQDIRILKTALGEGARAI